MADQDKETSSEAKAIRVTARILRDGQTQDESLEVQAEELVEKVKSLIASRIDNVTADRLRLIFHGRVLRDGDTLSASGIVDGNVIHVVVRSNTPPPPPSSSVPSSTNPPQPGAGAPPPPFPGMPAFNPAMFQNLASQIGAALSSQFGSASQAQPGNPHVHVSVQSIPLGGGVMPGTHATASAAGASAAWAHQGAHIPVARSAPVTAPSAPSVPPTVPSTSAQANGSAPAPSTSGGSGQPSLRSLALQTQQRASRARHVAETLPISRLDATERSRDHHVLSASLSAFSQLLFSCLPLLTSARDILHAQPPVPPQVRATIQQQVRAMAPVLNDVSQSARDLSTLLSSFEIGATPQDFRLDPHARGSGGGGHSGSQGPGSESPLLFRLDARGSRPPGHAAGPVPMRRAPSSSRGGPHGPNSRCGSHPSVRPSHGPHGPDCTCPWSEPGAAPPQAQGPQPTHPQPQPQAGNPLQDILRSTLESVQRQMASPSAHTPGSDSTTSSSTATPAATHTQSGSGGQNPNFMNLVNHFSQHFANLVPGQQRSSASPSPSTAAASMPQASSSVPSALHSALSSASSMLGSITGVQPSPPPPASSASGPSGAGSGVDPDVVNSVPSPGGVVPQGGSPDHDRSDEEHDVLDDVLDELFDEEGQ